MKVSEALSRIDWNFPRTGTEVRSVHAVHWFPGNFIPQIPRAFIEVLSNAGQVVFDPFGGSGTTAIEASSLSRRAILSDRLSACVLISQAKLDLQRGGLERSIKDKLLASFVWRHQCRSESFGANGEGSDPSLSSWFSPMTLSQLRFLWELIEQQSDSRSRRILRLLFSDVLFGCASPGRAITSSGKRRRHHWGWVADNVRPTRAMEHDAIGFFESRLAGLPEPTLPNSLASSLVIQQDARQLALPTSCVDLIVTSPPYIGMIDYSRANRLLYSWMNWKLADDRNNEIGARYKRRRLQAVDEYIDDMQACWREMCRVLRPGAHCAIVIGESRRFVGTVNRIVENLSKLLCPVWGPVIRTPSRRRVSDRGAHQAVEYLYVFRKP
jgi:hypothetical protein